MLAEEIAKLDLPFDFKLALVQGAGAGLGAAIGGKEGGAAGFNEASNNHIVLLALGRVVEVALRMGPGGLSAAQVAVVQRCIGNPSCKAMVESALPAGALAWFAG
ncbi:hypothetical protein ACFQOZ_19125 [Comamonas endophytica]|uniref:hypothetical protein n=1 Tax=Comamonas endophytica TaxID=2949090 RepID=UPI003620119E